MKTNTLIARLSVIVAFLIVLCGNFAVLIHYQPIGLQTVSNERPADNKVLPADISAVTKDLPTGFREQLEQSLQNKPKTGYSDEEKAAINKFYSESAFVGDSLLVAYRQYLQKNDPDGYFAKSTILCAFSYSTRAVLKPVTPDSLHPFYKGKKRQVWDAIKEAKSKRVFIIFWANEIPDANIQKANKNLEKVVSKLRAECPGIEIYIISPCYMYKNTYRTDKTDHINNPNLHALALSRKEFCLKNSAGYVEVSKYLGNEKDGLYEKYTSDKFVHVNNAAYDIWKQVFIDYALGREPDIKTT